MFTPAELEELKRYDKSLKSDNRKQYEKEYYQNNQARIKAVQKKYREKTKAQRREYMREYYRNNPHRFNGKSMTAQAI